MPETNHYVDTIQYITTIPNVRIIKRGSVITINTAKSIKKLKEDIFSLL